MLTLCFQEHGIILYGQSVGSGPTCFLASERTMGLFAGESAEAWRAMRLLLQATSWLEITATLHPTPLTPPHPNPCGPTPPHPTPLHPTPPQLTLHQVSPHPQFPPSLPLVPRCRREFLAWVCAVSAGCMEAGLTVGGGVPTRGGEGTRGRFLWTSLWQTG